MLRRQRPAKFLIDKYDPRIWIKKSSLAKTATQFQHSSVPDWIEMIASPPPPLPAEEKTNHLWWEIISSAASADVIASNMQ